MEKSVGDIIKELEKFPKEMKFAAQCVDMGGYSEQFEIVKQGLELNANEYSFYQGEHSSLFDDGIDSNQTKLVDVITLKFK